MKFLLSYIFCFTVATVLQPVDAPALLPETTAYDVTLLYAGPGETFQQIGRLNPGLPITIIERNQTGMWVHVVRKADGEIMQDGWVISAYLNRDDTLHFGNIPVNTSVKDADPTTVNSRSMAALYSTPIIPTISDDMVELYQRGQTMGKRSDTITKVGDSLSANVQYLIPMSNPTNHLGPYDYLKDTIGYYGSSIATDSVAARIGMSTYGIVDPFWADKTVCQGGETPLDCEYRIKQPSIAFIMFGPNDVRSMTEDKYAEQMRQIIDDSLKQGVIPVISTFSAHPDEEFFWQSINFNLQLVSLADEYKIPIINLWSAARILPEYGLDRDKVHLKVSGFDYLKYDTGHEAFYGVSLHNLLSICTLDAIRHKIGIEVHK